MKKSSLNEYMTNISYNLNDSEKFPVKAMIITLIISIIYLVFTYFKIGLKPEHIILITLYNVCFIVNRKTRKFISALAVFLIFGMLYDIMKVYPNYLVNTVDIESLYTHEKNIFGISWNNLLLTPYEYFNLNHSTFLDVLTGFFYVNWISVPILFAIYLYFRDKKTFLQFSFVFLFVNIIGFCIYYIHPAAPPWYVGQYGFTFHNSVHGSPGGLIRFDEFFNCHIFQSIYSRNSNVFAAIPSLHSSYPVVVLFYGIKKRLGLVNVFFVLFMMGIWFSAVYSGHHYVIDVILGICCALVGSFLFNEVIFKIPIVKKWLFNYENFIT